MLRKHTPRWVYVMCLVGAVVAAGLRLGPDMAFFTLAVFLWFEPRDPNEGSGA